MDCSGDVLLDVDSGTPSPGYVLMLHTPFFTHTPLDQAFRIYSQSKRSMILIEKKERETHTNRHRRCRMVWMLENKRAILFRMLTEFGESSDCFDRYVCWCYECLSLYVVCGLCCLFTISISNICLNNPNNCFRLYVNMLT